MALVTETALARVLILLIMLVDAWEWLSKTSPDLAR